MKSKKIKSGDKFNHKIFGDVEVLSVDMPQITFKKIDGICDTQHVNYFLFNCGKIKMEWYVPVLGDTIFWINENRYNYKLAKS